MSRVFEFFVPGRCPFVFGPVGALLRFRRFGLRSGISPIRNLSKSMVKLWHRGLGRSMRGTFGLQMPEGPKWIDVDSDNSHFETVLAWPHGYYEPAVRAVIDLLLPLDGTFFDIGANWGYYSLFVASRPGFHGRIHAFEPYPPTTADLENIVTQAGLGDRITIHGEALSDHDGEALMTVPHRVKRGQASIGDGDVGRAVPVRRVDDIDLPGPNFIKLDVEGHEFSVLKGARECLLRHRPSIVFENWLQPGQIDDMKAPILLLEELGYRVFAPAIEPAGEDDSVCLKLFETGAGRRSHYRDTVDLCAVHSDRIGWLEDKAG